MIRNRQTIAQLIIIELLAFVSCDHVVRIVSLEVFADYWGLWGRDFCRFNRNNRRPRRHCELVILLPAHITAISLCSHRCLKSEVWRRTLFNPTMRLSFLSNLNDCAIFTFCHSDDLVDFFETVLLIYKISTLQRRAWKIRLLCFLRRVVGRYFLKRICFACNVWGAYFVVFTFSVIKKLTAVKPEQILLRLLNDLLTLVLELVTLRTLFREYYLLLVVLILIDCF